jgi:anti-sigma factor RsiW
MLGDKPHLSDEELILFSDQELGTRDAAVARAHVARCESCRMRLSALENASAEFLMLHEQEIRSRNSSSLDSRNVLKARMAGASTHVRRSQRSTFLRSTFQQLGSASLAILFVVGSACIVRNFAHGRPGSYSMNAEATALPRHTLTPGSARAVQIAELCGSQDFENDPPVDTSLKQAVFREYGVPASSEENYQLDYLITPALGGVDSIQNLWPQPYSSTWNSRVKDQLEDRLHTLVCQGKLQLTTAQNDIATDWIEAYKRYFKTDQPQPGMATVSRRDNRNQRMSSISALNDLALIAISRE